MTDALRAAFAAIDPESPAPDRNLPARLPPDTDSIVALAAFQLSLGPQAPRMFGLPVQSGQDTIAHDPDDAPAIGATVANPSEAWLVGDTLHLFAFDGPRIASAAFKRARDSWQPSRNVISYRAASARGVRVYVGT